MKNLKLSYLLLTAAMLTACSSDSEDEPAGAILEQQETETDSDSSQDSDDSKGGEQSADDDASGDSAESSEDDSQDPEQSTDGDQEYNNSDDSMSVDSDYACGNSDHPKIGQLAIFETRAHQVTGQALIKDNCIIEVTNFTYDGLGPEVLFYGGVNGDYTGAGSGFALSENINGRAYDNETLTIELTSPVYLDQMNGISVWCADFDVSFGDGLFQ